MAPPQAPRAGRPNPAIMTRETILGCTAGRVLPPCAQRRGDGTARRAGPPAARVASEGRWLARSTAMTPRRRRRVLRRASTRSADPVDPVGVVDLFGSSDCRPAVGN